MMHVGGGFVLLPSRMLPDPCARAADWAVAEKALLLRDGRASSGNPAARRH